MQTHDHEIRPKLSTQLQDTASGRTRQWAIAGSGIGYEIRVFDGCEVLAVYHALWLYRITVPLCDVLRCMERFGMLPGFWGVFPFAWEHCLRQQMQIEQALVQGQIVLYGYRKKVGLRQRFTPLVCGRYRDSWRFTMQITTAIGSIGFRLQNISGRSQNAWRHMP